jgi:hypothetical protein
LRKKAFIGESGRKIKAIIDHSVEIEPIDKVRKIKCKSIQARRTYDQKKVLPNRKCCTRWNVTDRPRQEAVDDRTRRRKYQGIARGLLRLFIEPSDDQRD